MPAENDLNSLSTLKEAVSARIQTPTLAMLYQRFEDTKLELLEHVPDVQRVLSEISRVLLPSGYLLLSLPGVSIPKHKKLPFQEDYRRIPPGDVSDLLTTQGFRNIELDIKTLENLQVNIFATARRD